MLIRKGIKLKTSAHMTNANQDVSNAVGMKFANIKRWDSAVSTAAGLRYVNTTDGRISVANAVGMDFVNTTNAKQDVANAVGMDFANTTNANFSLVRWLRGRVARLCVGQRRAHSGMSRRQRRQPLLPLVVCTQPRVARKVQTLTLRVARKVQTLTLLPYRRLRGAHTQSPKANALEMAQANIYYTTKKLYYNTSKSYIGFIFIKNM